MLLMAEPTIALPVVLRSILEAYVDFKALIKDGSYGERMVATFECERERMLTSMIKSSNNPYHQHLLQHIDAKAELPKVKAEIARLRKLGYGRTSNRERFRAGDQEHEYESLYWLLCLDSHNSLAAVERRHIIRNGEDFELVAVKDNSVAQVCKWCDALTSILGNSTIQLLEFLGVRRIAEYERDLRDLEAIRAEIFGP
jgi:hypothetical protein